MSLETRFGANVGNVNVNLQGAKEQGREAQRTEEIQVLELTKPLVDIGNAAINIQTTQSAAEANTAKATYNNKIMSKEYMDASNNGKFEQLEGLIKDNTDQSPAFTNALQSYMSREYTSTYDASVVDNQESFYNSSGAAYESYKLSDVEGKSLENFTKEYSSLYQGLEPRIVGRAIVTESVQTSIVNLTRATEANFKEVLADAQEDMQQFSGPMFMGSQEKESKAYYNSVKTQFNNVVKAKQTEFKNEAFGRQAKAVQEGYRRLPSEQLKDIMKTADNPLAAQKQLDAYNAKYKERLAADDYSVSNPIGSRVHPLLKDNKMLMEERQEQVTQSLATHLISGNYEEFARIGFNEKDFGKKTGEYLLNVINQSTDSKDMKKIMGFLQTVNSTNQGPTALRQMFTDDEYTRLSIIESMSKYNADMSMPQLRDAYDKAKASTNIVKLDTATEMDIKEYAAELGPQYSNYLNVINQYKQINPQLAKDEYKNIAKYFSSTVDTDGGLDVTANTSMGMKPEAMDTEKFDMTLKEEVIKDGDTVTWIPNTKGETLAVVSNKLGDTRVVNTQPYVDDNKARAEYEAQRPEDRTILGDAGTAVKAVTRTLVDNAWDFVTGVPEVGGELIGNMGGRLVNHMIDSMTPDQAEFFNLDQKAARDATADAMSIVEGNKKFEAEVYEALENKKTSLVGTVPETSINTMGKYQQETVRQAILNNESQVQKINNVQGDKMISDMVKDFEIQEGSGDTLTDVKTGNLGVTENIKNRYGKDLSDKEVATKYLSDLSLMIDNDNPNIPTNLKKTLLDTLYNTGEGALEWSSIKAFVKNPTEETLQTAVLTKIYAGGKSVKGIGKRRAEAYNKSNPSKTIKEVEQKENGDMVYKDSSGSVIFIAKSTKERHSKSRAGTIKI